MSIHRPHTTMAERHHGPRPGHRPKHCANETDVAPPWTTTYKVAGIATMAAGSTSIAYPLYWPVSGMVRAIAGCARGAGGDVAMATIGVQIRSLDGREAFFKSVAGPGQAGEDFVMFASLFGYFGQRRCYLNRPVFAALPWQVTFRNFDGEATEYTPDLTFFLDEDPQGVRREWYKRVEVPDGVDVEVFGGGLPPRTVET